MRDRRAKYEGVRLGQRAAAAILALRADDGSQHAEPGIGTDYVPGDAPGVWRMDPISQLPVALGAHWGEVTPFVLASTDQFRVPPPPALDSAEYTAAFNEVTALGGDGVDDADAAQRGPDRDRHLLGLRRHAEPVRAAASLQPDRGADREAARLGPDGDGAAARAREHGDGRRGDRDLGVEVPLRVLAPGHGRSRVRPRHGAESVSATATTTRSAIRTSRRSARRRATSRR